MIQPDHLGTCLKSVTSHEETILQINESTEEVNQVIQDIKEKLLEEKNPNTLVKLRKKISNAIC